MSYRSVLTAFSLWVVVFVPAALAQASFKNEFDRVQRDYEVAAQQALEPVKRRHADTLQQLARRATTAGDLETALKIKNVLTQLGVSQTGGIKPPSAPLDTRIVGTRWTFPAKDQPKNQQWIEFRPEGVLALGWAPTPKTWKALGESRVEFRPYTADKYVFAIEFDANLKRGRFVEGEFKGQSTEPSK
ncbi:MAG: hypothetical protein ABMA13_22585 [Chthoniobacteraceae bacterium]